jgi:hypothetical protein
MGAHGWLGDSGPVGFSAWTLEQLGWIGPDNSRLHELMADTEDHVIEDVFKGGRIYKVHLPTLGSGEDSSAESPGYLLLEHRQRDSHYYNREIPADGVLVWHVRTAHEGNLEERHKMVI